MANPFTSALEGGLGSDVAKYVIPGVLGVIAVYLLIQWARGEIADLPTPAQLINDATGTNLL